MLLPIKITPMHSFFLKKYVMRYSIENKPFDRKAIGARYAFEQNRPRSLFVVLKVLYHS